MTRIRNASSMIQDILDHFAEFCNAGIYVFDDVSTDDTVAICEKHPAVKGIMRGQKWEESRSGRDSAEGSHRSQLFHKAMTESKPDWVFCFDSDEKAELDLTGVNLDKCDGIRLRLFDYYITPEDEDLNWLGRRWIGPEYRDILMMFRAASVKGFANREPQLWNDRILFKGFAKHYGKAISVADWENRCIYYGEHFPEPYQTKWLKRKGKAVKRDFKSDFGLPLIRWEERIEKGIPLTSRIHANEL